MKLLIILLTISSMFVLGCTKDSTEVVKAQGVSVEREVFPTTPAVPDPPIKKIVPHFHIKPAPINIREVPIRASRLRGSTKTLTFSGIWDRLALCEAGGNWSINTGNGYYGGLQFSLSSWRAVGGSGLPSNASRSEQIRRGEILRSRQGWGAWPACSRKLGLR